MFEIFKEIRADQTLKNANSTNQNVNRQGNRTFVSRTSNFQRNIPIENRRKGDWCRKCKQKGQWARDCPLNNNQEQDRTAAQTNVISSCNQANKVYLHGDYNGRRMLCLLDTGCDISVIESRLLPDVQLKPTKLKLLVANRRTSIPVIGETEITSTSMEHSLQPVL